MTKLLFIFISLLLCLGCYNPTVTSFKVAPHKSNLLNIGVSGMTNIDEDHFDYKSDADTNYPDMFFPTNMGYRNVTGLSLGYRRGLSNNRQAGADIQLTYFDEDRENTESYLKVALGGTFQKQINEYTGFQALLSIMLMNNPSMFDWSADNIWAFFSTFGFSLGGRLYAGIPIREDFLGTALEVSLIAPQNSKVLGTKLHIFYDKQIKNNTATIAFGIDPLSMVMSAGINYSYTFKKKDSQ